MNIFIIVCSLLVLSSTVLILISSLAHRRNHRSLLRLRARQLTVNSHIQKIRMDTAEARNRAKLLEDTVKHGTGAVEKMHQVISITTFSLIDHFSKDESFRQNARRVQETHDHTSRQIYQAARTTNKAVHLLADALFINRKEQKLVTQIKPKKKQ